MKRAPNILPVRQRQSPATSAYPAAPAHVATTNGAHNLLLLRECCQPIIIMYCAVPLLHLPRRMARCHVPEHGLLLALLSSA